MNHGGTEITEMEKGEIFYFLRVLGVSVVD